MARTASKPEEQTTPQAVRVGAREFRAQLKRFQDGEQAVVIGTPWHARGIFLPVKYDRYGVYMHAKGRAAFIRALLEAALTKADIE